MTMVLQGMNYINKAKTTENNKHLIVDAWNIIKTWQSKEGASFHNLLVFILAINKLYID